MNKNIKDKVLSEIMDLMDQKEGEKLSMHPKLMAMKIKVASPLDKKEDMKEMEPKELENEEMKSGSDLDELDKESLDPEMLAKLMKLLK